MPAPRRVSEYPWSALERLPRSVVRRLGDARRQLARAVALDRLGPALSELLASEVEIVMRDLTLRSQPLQPCRLAFETSDGGVRIVIGLEPSLATSALARLLGRSAGVGPTGAPLEPALSGALAALIVEAARRADARVPLRVASIPASAEPGLTLLATVLLDGRPYDASAIVWSDQLSERPVDVADLGELPVELGLVVSLAAIGGAELAALTPGAAWLPAEGWWIGRDSSGRGVLAAPGSERGIAVEVSSDGSLVVRGTESLPLEVETMSDDVSQTAAEAVLDAPLVVRVELGTVALSAREWARLGPGDVIETGRRIASPVTLRVAGRVVARGELVDVEGELGVRIRELVSQEESP